MLAIIITSKYVLDKDYDFQFLNKYVLGKFLYKLINVYIKA